MKNRGRASSMLACIILAFAGNAGAANLIDLGTLGTGLESTAVAVNDSGQVTGHSQTELHSTLEHAFLSSGGVMTDLGTLNGSYSRAADINNAGQVVGTSGHAFLFTGGMMTDIGSLNGSSQAFPTDINDAGDVAGFGPNLSPVQFGAFLYSGGTMTNLNPSEPDATSEARAVNESGQVTGVFFTDDASGHAFLYSLGVRTDLGTLGGSFSEGVAINDSGAVAGNWYDGSTTHGFLYTGDMTDLGHLGGGESEAVAINSSGEVVGTSTDKDGNTHAFVYRHGRMVDLGTLGGTYSIASAINDAGEIVGKATLANGNVQGFLYRDGVMTSLGDFVPVDISDTGYVAGNGGVVGLSHAFLRIPACGDAVVDAAEECDDGNTIETDCCASDCTYPGPATSCLAATQASLRIKHRAGKDRVVWKWLGGDPVTQADLGDPAASTTYRLCVSDSSGGVDRLVETLVVRPGTNWESADPDGWSYLDKRVTQSGVRILRLGTGDSGSKVQLDAKAGTLTLPEAFSETELFDQDSRVTVQLFNDSTSTCWSSEFTSASRNSATTFKANMP